MKAGLSIALEKIGNQLTDEQKIEKLNNLDEYNNIANIGKVIRGYFISIAVSGIVALLIALIIRKNKPLLEDLNQ